MRKTKPTCEVKKVKARMLAQAQGRTKQTKAEVVAEMFATATGTPGGAQKGRVATVETRG